MATKTLDVKGLSCPLPVLRANKVIKGMMSNPAARPLPRLHPKRYADFVPMAGGVESRDGRDRLLRTRTAGSVRN